MNQKTARKLRQYARVVRSDPEMIEAVTKVKPHDIPQKRLKAFWKGMTHAQRGAFRLQVIDRVI